ncbi:unnamed protein product [Schistocephalus solidus]|uniref:Uncharacterized protein n=1 Tax=Schistocephalus solidus TaxID=70667 RepID=A0A183SNH3_SCHSO|nr:unnamed protein product [Schistocephalus solidus]
MSERERKRLGLHAKQGHCSDYRHGKVKMSQIDCQAEGVAGSTMTLAKKNYVLGVAATSFMTVSGTLRPQLSPAKPGTLPGMTLEESGLFGQPIAAWAHLFFCLLYDPSDYIHTLVTNLS